MEPAIYERELDPGLVVAVLDLANVPTAGPTISAEVLGGSRVRFTAATWAPILRARVDDAVATV